MAEAELFGRSIDIGLDHVPEQHCEVCFEVHNAVKPVAGYCQNCDQDLCCDCFSTHLRRKPFQNHKLMDTRPKTKTAKKNARQHLREECNLDLEETLLSFCHDQSEECHLHQGEILLSFCQSHNQCCCKVCLTINHQACRTDKISKLALNIQGSQELKTLNQMLNLLDKGFQSTLRKTGANETVIKRSHSDALNDMKKLRNEFNKLMTKREAKADKVKEEDFQTIEKVSDTCSIGIEQINKLTNSLDTLNKNGEAESLFISMKRAESQLKSLKDILGQLDKDNTVRLYKFEPGKKLKSLFNDLKVLGKPLFGRSPTVGFPPQSTLGFPPQSTLEFPPQSTLGFPPQSTLEFPPQSTLGFPRQSTLEFPPQSTLGFPPQSTLGFPPQSTLGFPPQSTLGLPPQSTLGFPPQSTLGFPPQSTVGLPQQSIATSLSKQKDKKPININYITVTTASNKALPPVNGSVLLPNKQILITHFLYAKLKLIATNQDKIISEIQLSGHPVDITKVKDDEVAVTVNNPNKIKFVSVYQNSLSKGREISVNGRCRGIAYNEKDQMLIVTYETPGKVEILNMAGTVMKSIDKDSKGKPLFSSPGYVAVRSDMADMYITDSTKNSVTLMTINGDIKSVYTDSSLRRPQGICVHSSGLVYVVGASVKTILQLDPEGGEFKVLLEHKDGSYPRSISYCEREDKMYIGMDSESFLKVYQMK